MNPPQEIFQFVSQYPVLSGAAVLVGVFVARDILDGLRKGPKMFIKHHHMRQDARHAVSRRGEEGDE